MSSMFQSLGVFNYRVWFIGALVSNVGAWMQRTAQDWVVLTELTDNDALALGTISALQFLPALILMPVTGMITDRFDKRHVLFVTQGLQGVLAVLLAALTLSGGLEMWHMYFFAGALGLSTAFDNPARQIIVGDLVEDSALTNAVALNMSSMHGARLVGPAAAGLTVAAVGAGWAFAINAVSFGAMFIALLMMRRGEMRVRERVSMRPGDFFRGFGYVAKRKDLVALFAMMAFYGFFGLQFGLYAATLTVAFDGDAFQLGLVSTGSALGGLIGSLFVARRPAPRWRYMAIAPLFFAVFWIAAVAMPDFWWFLAILPLTGLVSQTYMITANTYVQLSTDSSMRGRVMALYQGVQMGAMPVGAVVMGWMIAEFGSRWAVGVASGIAGVMTGGIAILFVLSGSRVLVRRAVKRGRFTMALVPRERAKTVATPLPPAEDAAAA